MVSKGEIEGTGNGGDALLDVNEVAQEFNICTRGVWRAVARGDLPPPARLGRCCRWFKQDVVVLKRRLLEQRQEAMRQ